jgi:hypothetical protein
MGKATRFEELWVWQQAREPRFIETSEWGSAQKTSDFAISYGVRLYHLAEDLRVHERGRRRRAANSRETPG